MQWHLEFEIPQDGKPFGLNDRGVFLGSCFTEHIGTLMQRNGLSAMINPSGILFSPLAIARTMSNAISDNLPDPASCFFHEGVWRHFGFHSALSHPDKEVFVQNLHAAVNDLHQYLRSATHIYVTFGTAWVYTHKLTKTLVANNHKLPAAEFDKHLLAVEEIVETWVALLQQPEFLHKRWIFTVSPVRHIRDGVVENMRSKAILIEAIRRIQARCAQAGYFPAFELMMDDLRDYRFYASDLIHPNAEAIGYIWDAFQKSYLDKDTLRWLERYVPIAAAKAHKPLFPDSEAHIAFSASMREKILQMQKDFPQMRLQEDLQYFS